MDSNKKVDPLASLEDDSLETQSTEVRTRSSNPLANTNDSNALEDGSGEKSTIPAPGPDKNNNSFRRSGIVSFITTHLNVYILIFILLIIVAGVAIFASYQASKDHSSNNSIDVQNLSDKDLAAIRNSTTTVGDAKSILNVESNAVFSGKVLVRDSLEVAGAIKVGGGMTLPNITVSGTSQFEDIKLNNLSISGNGTVLGQLTIQKSLLVSGGGSFGGVLAAPQLNVDSLQVSKDLAINRHILAGGVTPGLSFGGALGNGGTASVNGSDTSGTVTINTGSGPVPGTFATINFNQKFNSTPHVVITPVGSGGAGLNYYVTRSTSGFTINTTNSAPAGTSFSFDYIVID